MHVERNSPVVFAYDGSEGARDAIRAAIPLLAPRRALVVHVWQSLAGLLLHADVSSLKGTIYEAAREPDHADAEAGRREAEAGAALLRKAGLETSPMAVEGKPKAWPAILEVADRERAALIVVGSRGLTGVKSVLLGSVSGGVVNHSARPVLVVPADGKSRADGPVVIAYDRSEGAKRAMAAAGELLAPSTAVVVAACRRSDEIAAAATLGLPGGVLGEAAGRLDDELEATARRSAEEGARLAAEAGFDATAETVRAGAAVWSALDSFATERQPSVIVVGSHGRSAVGAAILGSTSRSLVHHSQTPVLVVPPADW